MSSPGMHITTYLLDKVSYTYPIHMHYYYSVLASRKVFPIKTKILNVGKVKVIFFWASKED